MMAVARRWYAALRPAVDAWPVYRPMDGPTLRRMVDACAAGAAAHVVLTDGADGADDWEALVAVALAARLLAPVRASLRVDLVGGRTTADTVNPALRTVARSAVLRRVRSLELRVFRQSAAVHPDTMLALVHAVVNDPRSVLESLCFRTDRQHWPAASETVAIALRSLLAFALWGARPPGAAAAALQAFDLRFDRCPTGVGRWFVPAAGPLPAVRGLRILRLQLPYGEWDARGGSGLPALLDAVAAQDRLQILHLDLSHAYLRDAWRNNRRPLTARGLRSVHLAVRSAALDVRSLRDLLAWVLTARTAGGPLECAVDARDNRIDCSPAAWSAFPWQTEWAWTARSTLLALDLRTNLPRTEEEDLPPTLPRGVRCVVDPAEPRPHPTMVRDCIRAPTSFDDAGDGNDIYVWTNG